MISHKIIKILSSQIRVSDVKLANIDEKPHKILQDNNQSFEHGAINDTDKSDLRGQGRAKKRGRPKKS
jgi:hypothetical protein